MERLPRRAIVLRDDDPEVTLGQAREMVASLPAAEVFWAEGPAALRGVSGGDFSAVVVDLHQRLSLDALGLAHGLVRGGGSLVLRAPHQAPPDRSTLAAPPFPPSAAGRRTWSRLQPWLRAAPTRDEPLSVAPAVTEGTREQSDLVAQLTAALANANSPSAHVVIADRGRGKSAALGMMLAQLRPHASLAVTAPTPTQLVSVRRFDAKVDYVAPLHVGDVELLVVDEAAGLAVPTLKALSQRARHVVMATTVHGYEGHGRGFSLRFLPWLKQQRPTEVHRLEAPIRWASEDPLERWIFDGLLLDATPAADPIGTVQWARLDRDELATDETMLRQVFGLLVAAHYRTTPDDLMRLLDAANLEVHVLRTDNAVAAACLVAREGKLRPEDLAPLLEGRGRLRGQALAETLARHSDEPEAAGWDLRRNLRTAVHPSRRREGLGATIAAAVHADAKDDDDRADAFGTMFGATPGLLAFRRAQGYRLVRLGATRSDRSGLMSVVMLRPSSSRATALVARLRARLAVDLPHQLRLATSEHPVPRDLALAFREGLDLEPSPLSCADHHRRLRRYLDGTQTDWAIAGTLAALAEQADLTRLSDDDAALVRGRLLEHRAWRDLARERGASVRVTMRGLREAIAVIEPPPLWGTASSSG